MTKPYYYVRFRWDMGVDIGKVAGELAEGFNVEEVKTFESDRDMTLYKGHREELKATADSLTVLLSRTRSYTRERRNLSRRRIWL
jgi:hypothetical protein